MSPPSPSYPASLSPKGSPSDKESNEMIYLSDKDAKDFIDEVVTQRCSVLPIRLYDTSARQFISRTRLSEVVRRRTLRKFTEQNTKQPLRMPLSSPRRRASDEEYHRIKRIVLFYTKFAILSHTWGDNELSYQEIRDEEKALTDCPKFVGFAITAINLGCQYIWIDTACIDKSSSSELDESIRSMFTWYRTAYVCVVYLESKTRKEAYNDRWKRRGWTLQESLAPKRMIFYTHDWERLAPLSMQSLACSPNSPVNFDVVRVFDLEGHDPKDTRIEVEYYNDIPFISPDVSFVFDNMGEEDQMAYKPSAKNARTVFTWMVNRRTTVPEDSAYCLLGLLGIVLAPAYGEGKEHALYRLQVACAERSNERNLFLWDFLYTSPSQFNSMLPKDPFAGQNLLGILEGPQIVSVTATELWNHHPQEGITDARVDLSFTFTNSGLRIKAILHDISPNGEVAGKVVQLITDSIIDCALCKLAIVGTYSQDGVDNQVFAIVLMRVGAAHSRQYRRIPCNTIPWSLPPIEVLLSRKPEKVYIV